MQTTISPTDAKNTHADVDYTYIKLIKRFKLIYIYDLPRLE